MKIKSVRLSFIIFLSLTILSFGFFVSAKNSSDYNVFLDSDQDDLSDEEEKTYGTDPFNKDTDGDSYSDGAEISAGYDPTKPAPGDKIVTEEKKVAPKLEDAGNNVTKQLAFKITDLAQEEENGQSGEVSLEQLEGMVEESLNPTFVEESLPTVDENKIKIKEQNYSQYSEEKALERKKEDFANYLSTILYIFSNNSPKPISSGKDMENGIAFIFQEITNALTTRDDSSLSGVEKSGEKMLEQIYEVEVPEDLLDVHIKALQFALYAQELRKFVNSNSEDPVADIANLSKMQGFMTEFISFFTEVESKFNEYGGEEIVTEKVKSFGIDLTSGSQEDSE